MIEDIKYVDLVTTTKIWIFKRPLVIRHGRGIMVKIEGKWSRLRSGEDVLLSDWNSL